jgi:genome maintenance exonuclease 1
VNNPTYERLENETGRYYDCGNGKWYPSVTTMLGKVMDHTGLDIWRNRVGEVQADKITKQSSDRGTELHDYIEHYLKNEPFSPKFPMVKWMFTAIKKDLDLITNIKGLELRMHSDKLKLAGTTDCVGEYKGLKSIIDFKNSNRMKTKDEILGYFIQTTIYSIMYYERYGLLYPNLVIIMATEQNKGLIFVDHIKNYMDLTLKLVKEFHNNGH